MFRNAAETILGKKSNLIEELQELYYERKETCHNKLVVKRLWSDNIFLGRNRLNIKSPPPWPLSKQFHLFNPFLLYSALCTMGWDHFWVSMYNSNKIRKTHNEHLIYHLIFDLPTIGDTLMANICGYAISILVENLNSGLSYLIKTTLAH